MAEVSAVPAHLFCWQPAGEAMCFPRGVAEFKFKEAFMQRLSSGYVFLLLSVFLLAFPAGGYEAIADFKFMVFLVICGGYCVLAVLLRGQLAIIGVEPIKLNEVKRPSVMSVLLGGYLFFSVVSAVLSDYSGVLIGRFRNEGVLTTAILVMSCFFLAQYMKPQKWMIFLAGATATIFLLLCVVQLTGANPFGLYPEGHNFHGADIYYLGAFIGTIGNRVSVGEYVSILSGVLTAIFVKYEFRFKWLLAIPFALAGFVIFSMGSNAAVLALLAGFVLMLPLTVSNKNELGRMILLLAIIVLAYALANNIYFLLGMVFVLFAWVAAKKMPPLSSKTYRMGGVLIVCIITVAVVIYLFFFGELHEGMMYEAAGLLQGRWDDSFGSSRIYIWRRTIESIEVSNLFFGTGPDTLGHWGLSFGRIVIDDAHNKYLHILATRGLFALLCWLGVLVCVFITWIRNFNNPLIVVAGAGVLFYSIQAFFAITTPVAAPFLWLCISLTKGEMENEKINSS